MHIIGIIFAHVPVSVVRQRHFIVLRAVNDVGLKRGIYLTEAHRRGRTAKALHHFHVGGRLLYPDLQPL